MNKGYAETFTEKIMQFRTDHPSQPTGSNRTSNIFWSPKGIHWGNTSELWTRLGKPSSQALTTYTNTQMNIYLDILEISPLTDSNVSDCSAQAWITRSKSVSDFKSKNKGENTGKWNAEAQMDFITLITCLADLTTISLLQRSHRWGRCLVPPATFHRNKGISEAT